MADRRIRVGLPGVDYLIDRVPCQAGCPVRTDAGRYVQLITQGEYRDAYLTARSPNPFASVCGRVCAAPCEDRCRRGNFDASVSIRALKRFVTERFGIESRNPDTWLSLREGTEEPGNKWLWHLSSRDGRAAEVTPSQKVAVIGGGPAGLSCAHDLALLGYDVTVFEASPRAGGMAVHGIPDFRLPRSLLDREIQSIIDLGVDFRFNTPLTVDFGLADVFRQGYSSTFIAIGTQHGRDLRCPGSELDGIIRAIDYLLNINNGFKVPRARRVVVVGGGFVAFDAARMALRAMADEGGEEAGGGMQPALDAARIAARAGSEVILASLESFEEMPVMRTEQGREEFHEARREGVEFLPQRSVVRFEGNGRVQQVHLQGVERTYDEQGRFAPVFDESIEEQIETDLVIIAIGQRADLSFLSPGDGVETTPAGTIRVDPDTLATTAKGVFAGGDVAFGPRNLIDAIANGKRAAAQIDRYLRPQAGGPAFVFRFEKIPTGQFARSVGYEQLPRLAPPTIELGRRTGISEVETSYGEAEATNQAERCLACHIQTIYDWEKCVLCNRCVDICPENCLKLVPLEDVDLPEAHAQAVREMSVANDGVSLSAMIKDDETCIRCGLCAIRCPTDAMTMEVLYYEQYEAT